MVVVLIIAISPKTILLIVPWMTWYFLVCVDLLNMACGLLVVNWRLAAAAVAGDLRQGRRHIDV